MRYNDERLHWELKPRGGGDLYIDGLAVEIPSWQCWANAANEKLQRMVGIDHFPQLGSTK